MVTSGDQVTRTGPRSKAGFAVFGSVLSLCAIAVVALVVLNPSASSGAVKQVVWDGAFPQPELSPGDVDASFTAASVCTLNPGTDLPVPAEAQAAVFETYGIGASVQSDYEVARVIPTFVGGSDAPRNLWPRSVRSTEGLDKLNELANQLRHEVCTEGQPLAVAQEIVTATIAVASVSHAAKVAAQPRSTESLTLNIPVTVTTSSTIGAAAPAPTTTQMQPVATTSKPVLPDPGVATPVTSIADDVVPDVPVVPATVPVTTTQTEPPAPLPPEAEELEPEVETPTAPPTSQEPIPIPDGAPADLEMMPAS